MSLFTACTGPLEFIVQFSGFFISIAAVVCVYLLLQLVLDFVLRRGH